MRTLQELQAKPSIILMVPEDSNFAWNFPWLCVGLFSGETFVADLDLFGNSACLRHAPFHLCGVLLKPLSLSEFLQVTTPAVCLSGLIPSQVWVLP